MSRDSQRPADIPADTSSASRPVRAPDAAPTARVRFSERLVPGPGGWVAILVSAVVLGAGLVPASALIGYGTGGAVLVVGAALAWIWSPRVQVTDSELSAGRACIPLRHLGSVVVLDRAGVSEAMGTAWDPRAHACLRAWTGGAVRVEVTDPQDATPYWIVSSRRAQELAAALGRRG